jgi:hypothetical protein
MVVVPLPIPENVPDVLIVPTVVLDDDHVPPAGELDKNASDPIHIAAIPVIADGAGLMVTLTEASGPQQPAADCTLK